MLQPYNIFQVCINLHDAGFSNIYKLQYVDGFWQYYNPQSIPFIAHNLSGYSNKIAFEKNGMLSDCNIRRLIRSLQILSIKKHIDLNTVIEIGLSTEPDLESYYVTKSESDEQSDIKMGKITTKEYSHFKNQGV